MAVRRMAFIKMYHAFASWRELVAAKREAAQHYQQLDASAWAHMQVRSVPLCVVWLAAVLMLVLPSLAALAHAHGVGVRPWTPVLALLTAPSLPPLFGQQPCVLLPCAEVEAATSLRSLEGSCQQLPAGPSAAGAHGQRSRAALAACSLHRLEAAHLTAAGKGRVAVGAGYSQEAA